MTTELVRLLGADRVAAVDPSVPFADACRRRLPGVHVAVYRLSSSYPDYGDIRPFHEAMLEANPDQLVWGSDWPHVRMSDRMPDGQVIDRCLEWTGDDELARKVLVDNPARLYGWEPR